MFIRKFHSLAEIQAEPGYVEKIAHVKQEAPQFLGFYQFKDKIHCARVECNKPHGYGYVVRSKSGAVVAIGNVCGAELFGDIWTAAAGSFNAALALQTLEQSLREQLATIPGIVQRATEMVGAPGGARSFEIAENSLKRACPSLVLGSLYEKARTGDSEVTSTRPRTKQDPPGTGKDRELIVDRIGYLQGLAALAQPSPMYLLRDRIILQAESFKDCTPEMLIERKLLQTRFKDWIRGVPEAFRLAENRLANAPYFFNTENLQLFVYLTHRPWEKEAVARIRWNAESGTVESGRAAA